jgi:hypothetical protein
VKDSFYVELECVFDKFPKYHMKILLGDFSAKVGRETDEIKMILAETKILFAVKGYIKEDRI